MLLGGVALAFGGVSLAPGVEYRLPLGGVALAFVGVSLALGVEYRFSGAAGALLRPGALAPEVRIRRRLQPSRPGRKRPALAAEVFATDPRSVTFKPGHQDVNGPPAITHSTRTGIRHPLRSPPLYRVSVSRGSAPNGCSPWCQAIRTTVFLAPAPDPAFRHPSGCQTRFCGACPCVRWERCCVPWCRIFFVVLLCLAP